MNSNKRRALENYGVDFGICPIYFPSSVSAFHCVFLRLPVRGIGAWIIDPSILLFVPLLMIFREQRSNAENMIRHVKMIRDEDSTRIDV